MDLDITDVPERDTRNLVTQVGNYFPTYTSLLKVIPDSNKVDELLTAAIDAPVLYSGTTTEVSTTQSKGFFGFGKRTEVGEVSRQEVEGLLWFKASEVKGDTIEHGQLSKVEFGPDKHDKLEEFVKDDAFNTLLKHPGVSENIITHLVSQSTLKEIAGLQTLLSTFASNHPNILKEENLHIAKTKVLAMDPPAQLCKAVLHAKEFKYGCGPAINKTPDELTFLEHTEKGYNVVIEPTQEALIAKHNIKFAAPVKTKSSGKELRDFNKKSGLGSITLSYHFITKYKQAELEEAAPIPKLSEHLSDLVTLRQVIDNGFAVRNGELAILFTESTGQKIIAFASMPKVINNNELEVLKSNIQAIQDCLAMPDCKDYQTETLSRLLRYPTPTIMAEGLSLICAQPPAGRKELDKCGGEYRLQRGIELLDTAKTIGTSNPSGYGVVLSNSTKAEKRIYLKWVNGVFAIEKAKANAPDNMINPDSPIQKLMKLTGPGTRPTQFIRNSDNEVLENLLVILADSDQVARRLANIYGLHKNSRCLVKNATKIEDRIYAMQDAYGKLQLYGGKGLDPKVLGFNQEVGARLTELLNEGKAMGVAFIELQKQFAGKIPKTSKVEFSAKDLNLDKVKIKDYTDNFNTKAYTLLGGRPKEAVSSITEIS